jgi:hypothetical protein
MHSPRLPNVQLIILVWLRERSAGNDQIHGLRTFALLVGLDIETDLLPFV